ncbi:MAG TPA: response regulator transcription factor [Anaerolineales bacterium]|nr:response regulator transcription factor [Anaerolineales bacterium]
MLSKIHVAILDDHQSIIDGFIYRLSSDPAIQIDATATFGEDLEPMVADHDINVLLLDVSVPNSAENHNPFPILYVIPRLLQKYPSLNILIISMFTQRTLIDALVDIGVSGYIFKDDQTSIQQLAKIVTTVANGGIYFSPGAVRDVRKEQASSILTPRQLEVLSLCNAQPDSDTTSLASKLGISGSTLRNLLSGAYLRLGVRTRAAAIAKAHELGIIPVFPKIAVGEDEVKKKP